MFTELILWNCCSNRIFPNLDELLPKPIITDIESDGVSEVVMVTPDLQIEILALPQDSDPGILPHLEVKHSTPLPINTQQEDGRTSMPIAMDTGYLTKYESMVQVRKQVSQPNNLNYIIFCTSFYANSLIDVMATLVVWTMSYDVDKIM